jgi:sugar lactone lactonase YvrE
VFDPKTGQDRSVDVGQPVGVAALRERGGLVLALRDGFAVLDADLRDLHWVARVEDSVPTNRMNDGKCDAAGRFWAGTQRVDAFDFDLEQGTLGDRHTIINVPPEVGLPDGMTVDAEGGLWVAVHGSGAIHRYTPDGTLERILRVPARQVTCCAFGGADFGDLYITSMTHGLSPEALQDQPLAGAIFRTRPGVRGRPSHRFAG